MWKPCYENMFNDVKDRSCDNLCISDKNGMTVNPDKMVDICNGLSYNKYVCIKSTGLDSIAAEHIKFADPQLVALLSRHVPSIRVHGYTPKTTLLLCQLLKTRI